MDVFRDQSELELNISNEQRLARQLEATVDRFQVGEVTRTDVFQAEARLARATSERIQAEGRLEISRANYRNAVGKAPGTLSKPDLPGALPQSLEEAIDWALNDNPDVSASAYDERSALDSVDRVRGQLLPTLRLTGRVARDYEVTQENSETTTFEALLRMDLPIFTAGTDYSQLRQAKQIVAQRRRQLDQAQRETVRNATDGWSALETARAAILSRVKQVEANQVALDGVQREAEVGARTVLDILDAEQELLDSQVDLVRSQREELVAAYQLKAAVGDMTARRLRLDVPLYDPREHYREVRDAWFSTTSSGGISDDFNSDRDSGTSR
ncbi:MAG: TolC family protein [Rhodospirillales bacterium]|nr:TolC family protein [Rhodospirillales bacterium]